MQGWRVQGGEVIGWRVQERGDRVEDVRGERRRAGTKQKGMRGVTASIPIQLFLFTPSTPPIHPNTHTPSHPLIHSHIPPHTIPPTLIPLPHTSSHPHPHPHTIPHTIITPSYPHRTHPHTLTNICSNSSRYSIMACWSSWTAQPLC